MADPDRTDPSDAETHLLRGKTRGPAPATRPSTPAWRQDAAESGPRPRIWPPRPEEAPATVPDFSLDGELTDTLGDKTPQRSKQLTSSAAEDATSAAAPVAAPVVRQCPRCHDRLIDPDGLGLCSTCGYCRSLAEDGAKVPSASVEAEAQPQPGIRRELVNGVVNIPGWVWVLFTSAVIIVLWAQVASQLLPARGPDRAIWSTAQLVLGAALMLGAQWWAAVKLAADHEHIGALDLLVLSGRLWARAFARLPATRGPVYLGFWGLMLMIAAVTITGGLAEWFTPGKGSPFGGK